MESPFDILQIDADADAAEIESAYRRRVKEAHPDHGGSAAEFRRVQAAYEELTSGARRSEWIGKYGNEYEYENENAETEADNESKGGSEDEHPQRESARVEYLNFEVLDDYGWELEDDDLFENAADERLATADYGRFLVKPNETVLEAAENRGFAWPYACRGGACANCAVVVTEGEMTVPVNHILPAEMIDRGVRLSCVGTPITDELKVVYNVKHLPDLDELRLPPRPFEQAQVDD
ncbi:ferredoxin Fer [Halomontanus rarus]|uniref:ferredoxin Fer n=1 Tax=Halomontanus rarus TaxID=3034020 RepID=UPI0031F2DCFB